MASSASENLPFTEQFVVLAIVDRDAKDILPQVMSAFSKIPKIYKMDEDMRAVVSELFSQNQRPARFSGGMTLPIATALTATSVGSAAIFRVNLAAETRQALDRAIRVLHEYSNARLYSGAKFIADRAGQFPFKLRFVIADTRSTIAAQLEEAATHRRPQRQQPNQHRPRP